MNATELKFLFYAFKMKIFLFYKSTKLNRYFGT